MIAIEFSMNKVPIDQFISSTTLQNTMRTSIQIELNGNNKADSTYSHLSVLIR